MKEILKHMKHCLLFCSAAICICFSCYAQPENKPEVKRWAVSLSPGTVPLPGNPFSLQPGVEFFFTPKISLLNEVSLQTEKNNDFDSAALNKRYFKYKAEARYYLSANTNRVIPYFGLQFTTASRKFDIGKADRYYDTFQDDSVYTFTSASVNSPVQTLTGQFGLSARVIDNFYFETSFGYGVRFINTTYSAVENPAKIRNVGLFNIKPISSYRYEGKLTRTQLNLGFRVSYRF
jgi:hypothetical protein